MNAKKPTDLVIDSTGLKIFGEGEWKMRTHGKQKRRTWRKYHVCVNPARHEVTAIELSEADVHDCTVLPALLLKQKNIGTAYAYGAYSFKQGFDAIAQSGGTPSIPIRSGTTAVKKAPAAGEELRNKLLDLKYSPIWHDTLKCSEIQIMTSYLTLLALLISL
jgi:hypothetical protein